MVAYWPKVLQTAPLGAFCNTLDLHQAIIGLENQFSVFLRECPFYTGFTYLRSHCSNLSNHFHVYNLGTNGPCHRAEMLSYLAYMGRVARKPIVKVL